MTVQPRCGLRYRSGFTAKLWKQRPRVLNSNSVIIGHLRTNDFGTVNHHNYHHFIVDSVPSSLRVGKLYHTPLKLKSSFEVYGGICCT